MLTISIQSLRKHSACALSDRIADLEATLDRKVEESEAIGLDVWWRLKTTSVADMFWSLRACDDQEEVRKVGVMAACRAARRVLYLTRGQDHATCLAAIEAAESVLEGTHTWQQARDAADAAADAAYAAAAAAYAAYAAADAAAAYAADAADAAVDAADAAADAADAAYAAAERAAQRKDLFELAGIVED